MTLKKFDFIDFESKNKLTKKLWLVMLLYLVVHIIYLICQQIALVPFTIVYMIQHSGNLDAMLKSDALYIFSLLITSFGIAAALVYVRFIEKRPLATTGITKKNIFSQYGMGYLLGIVMIGIPALILVLFNGNIYRNANANYGLLFLYFFGFLIQGASEEVMIRGYLFTSLRKTGNLFWAVTISSLVFALLHIFNPAMSIIPFINLFLFGVFACFFFLRTKNIWAISALHSAWNFFQGNIFGIQVSGTVVDNSLLNIKSAAPKILSGGDFGLEGGLIVTAILVISTILTIFCGKNNLIAGKETFSEPAE